VEIKVLGPGCSRCHALFDQTSKAVAASGVEGVTLVKVERISDITAHGVMMTPALVIDGKVVSQGQVPEARQIVTWITNAAATG